MVQPQLPAEPSSQEKLALDSVFEEFSGSWRGGASGALLSYWSLARECERENSARNRNPRAVPLLS